MSDTEILAYTDSKITELEKGLAESKVREQALGERVLQLEKDKGKLIDENREVKKENKQLSDRLQEFSGCECCKSLHTKDKCRSCDDTLCNWEFEY